MPIMSSGIFPTADDARVSGQSYLTVHNECRSIEGAILFAISAGLYTAYVINTTMTATTEAAWTNLTSISTTTNVINLPGHGLLNGTEIQFQSTLTLPSAVNTLSTYYVTVIDVNNFKISTNFINQATGQFVSFADAGTGTIKIRKIVPAQQFYRTWQGQRDDRGQALQMNNVITYFRNLGYDISRQVNPNTDDTFSMDYPLVKIIF